ncbi:restriction endonuclease [Pseudarthrobacter phenanthrenivorans]|uniref:restriction endonuclease n=1 Tax=Pseudarthrobacter phenanthrenivorans TaxID=361575 RepID=UPI00112BF09F|nr:restriction endonuclease [Pseudarthrobacter phenanthrenivorans]TPV49681.1 restriction endonuclease [Pseudarthrobacter phenanthrenivorans]
MTETIEQDGIPKWHGFMSPILQVLADGQPRTRSDVTKQAMDVVGLTDEQRAIQVNSGSLKAKGRVGWALSHLIAATALERPDSALYVITDVGRQLLSSNPEGVTQAQLREIEAYRRHRAEVRAARKEISSAPEADVLDEDEDPMDVIDAAMDRIKAEVGAELIQRLRDSDPEFFEQAVVDLLLKMGYGGAEQRGRRIGGSGDGGVDGVIDQDALGLDRIYVQAKRYADGNTVGRETIQAFVGALHGVGASRGVFITTSTFTSGARQYAENVPSRIILIDSVRLVSLMIKYRVGVQVKQSYDVVELDEDFFE